jgi:hypothetical protein
MKIEDFEDNEDPNIGYKMGHDLIPYEVTIKRLRDGDIKIVKFTENLEEIFNDCYHPDDICDNSDIIPKKPGIYTYNMSLRGGSYFTGEETEYWQEFLLYNLH